MPKKEESKPESLNEISDDIEERMDGTSSSTQTQEERKVESSFHTSKDALSFLSPTMEVNTFYRYFVLLCIHRKDPTK